MTYLAYFAKTNPTDFGNRLSFALSCTLWLVVAFCHRDIRLYIYIYHLLDIVILGSGTSLFLVLKAHEE